MHKGWPLLLLLGSCGGQPAITPGGIVSNNPCIDSILARIAAPGQIAAVSSYSHDAESGSAPVEWARQYPALGTGAEDIITARPRLVLTGNLASSGTNAALAKAGLKVVPVGVAPTLAEDIAQVRTVARAIGRVKAGEELVAEMEEATTRRPREGGDLSNGNATSAYGQFGVGLSPGQSLNMRGMFNRKLLRGDDDAPTAIIWQNGGFVAGAGTVQDELLRRQGFVNASAGYGLQSWDILPIEVLIRNPPDVIFMPMSAKGAEARALSARQKLLGHLKGKTRVMHFPDKLLFCGGPTTIKVARIFAKTREETQ